VDQKSNEITAIPKLLEIIDVSGALVTIDALGRQTGIARRIVNAKVDYRLAVKGNRPTLYKETQAFFDEHLEDDLAHTRARRHATDDKAHGREARRDCFIGPVPDESPDRPRWVKSRAIGITIHHTRRDGQECYDVRYYILSKYLSARRVDAAAGGHWGIGNC
jgi:predicted transposase YbfD/YdcC